jgi:putative endonuclease
MKPCVYVLESLKDKHYYIGSTRDINKRFKEHENGYVRSTKNRRPLKLKYILEYDDIKTASKMEKIFKKSKDALKRELVRRNLLENGT